MINNKNFEADETNESLSLTLSVCIGHIMTIEASNNNVFFFILSFCLYADTKTNANTCIKLFLFCCCCSSFASFCSINVNTRKAVYTLQYWFFRISFFSAVVNMFLIFHLPSLSELFGKCNDDDDDDARERERERDFWLTNNFSQVHYSVVWLTLTFFFVPFKDGE